MKKIIPSKLHQGDEIRVIAPSRSMCILGEDCLQIATEFFNKYGLKVTYGKNVNNSINDEYLCASIEDRLEDFHDAIKDPNVKAIFTAIGGYNSNQLLDYLDYDLIKNNPKIICGYSDITAILASIYAKTGLVTYYGPHFSTMGMKLGKEYIETYFRKILLEDGTADIIPSKEWSDDLWFIDQDKREFISNEGMHIINNGVGEGTIIGGNLCTLNLLQGTEYMPKAKDYILFIEDDGESGECFTKTFDRDFQSLIHSIGAQNIKGIVVGRAQKNTSMTNEKWHMIFNTKKELKSIPIVINADFGHTTPMITFPIGGTAKLNINDNDIKIKISE